MARYIENLTECTDPTTGDYLWVVDASAGSTDKDRKVDAGRFAQLSAGTWSPTITGSSSNPSVAYSAQIGRYSRIGDVVFFDAYIVINTTSGGSGDARISLPIINSTGRQTVANAYTAGVDLGGTPVNVLALIPSGAQYFVVDSIQDNAGVSRLQISGLAAGDGIYATGFYFA